MIINKYLKYNENDDDDVKLCPLDWYPEEKLINSNIKYRSSSINLKRIKEIIKVDKKYINHDKML